MEKLETMSFTSHLEVLRQMLVRVLLVILGLSVVVFFFKEETFRLLLAPKDSHFITFRLIEQCSEWLSSLMGSGDPFRFDTFNLELINTDLSAQFMTHMMASFSIGALLASPYILFELFRFITPALYANERRYSLSVGISCYLLFIIGVVMSYFVLIPISFRFLGNYQVDESVRNFISLDSYISTFTSLTFTMGLVFQLPIICWFMAKLGILRAQMMRQYRRHAFVLILIVAAIITPPDLFTLFLVSLPLYLLYELCIGIVGRIERPVAKS